MLERVSILLYVNPIDENGWKEWILDDDTNDSFCSSKYI
jgi:hypothetical protein